MGMPAAPGRCIQLPVLWRVNWGGGGGALVEQQRGASNARDTHPRLPVQTHAVMQRLSRQPHGAPLNVNMHGVAQCNGACGVGQRLSHHKHAAARFVTHGGIRAVDAAAPQAAWVSASVRAARCRQEQALHLL